MSNYDRLSPSETTSVFRSFHMDPDYETRGQLIRDAPTPRGCNLSLKVEGSSTKDQDRLNLPK